MADFRVKLLRAKLFGEVEAPQQEPWLSNFASAGTDLSVIVRADALDFISDELGIEVDGEVLTAMRYTRGEFRPKSQGLSGSCLGDFGEVLTYLIQRSLGLEIVRVVGFKPLQAGAERPKGRFPMPDFLLRGGGNGDVALEVKSTQAFDYLKLRDVNNWKHLAPCSKVASCRAAALEQVGFEDDQPVEHDHELELGDAKTSLVAFPYNKGVVVAVLVVDGRTRTFRNDPRYMTPPECRHQKRDCWRCVDDETHAVVSVMESVTTNGPPVPLASQGPDLFALYRNWTQALSMSDHFAIEASTRRLAAGILAWGGSSEQIVQKELVSYWGGYLATSAFAKGVRLDSIEGFGSSSASVEQSVPDVPNIVLDSSESIPLLLERLARAAEPARGSVDVSSPKQEMASLSVERTKERLTVRLASAEWWKRVVAVDASDPSVATRLTEDHAAKIAGQLVELALGLSADEWVPSLRRDLRPVMTQVGENSVNFGWRLSGMRLVHELLRQYEHQLSPRLWRFWPFVGGYGSFSLRVTTDGRGYLSLPVGSSL